VYISIINVAVILTTILINVVTLLLERDEAKLRIIYNLKRQQLFNNETTDINYSKNEKSNPIRWKSNA